MQNAIIEPSRWVPVFDETDVLVVGAGPAGIAAALSAARLGANVVMMDRYGKLGGLATGGIVAMLPNIDNGSPIKCLGIQKEWVDRLRAVPNAIYGPDAKEVGQKDPRLAKKWALYGCNVWDGKVCDSVFFDPEYLSIIFCEMITAEKRIKTYLHVWAVRAYMEDNTLKGVIFESKEGRKAILAKLIIDCTGEGDIYASAGAEYEFEFNQELRNTDTSLVYRLANTDFEKFATYEVNNKEEYRRKMAVLQEEVGYRLRPVASNRNDNIWVNNHNKGFNCLDVKDLTALEFKVRLSFPRVLEYLRSEIPGFEKSYLMDFASQAGVRSARRLKGLYQIQFEDFQKGIRFEDTIAATPAMHCCNAPDVGEVGMFIPYRSLIPERLDNLIAAGRCISCDLESHNWLNLIPHSVATGEAAGAAAYMALNESIQPRDVNVKKLQKVLVEEKGCCIG